jgi:hypothetical protein
LLVGNKEFSLVTNAEGKGGKILSTKVGKRLFGIIDVWEKPLKIQSEFMKKLRAGWFSHTLTTIRYGILCLLVHFPRIQKLKYTNYNISFTLEM